METHQSTVKRKYKTRIHQRRKSRRIQKKIAYLWDTHLHLIKIKDMKYTILIVTGLETQQRRIGRTIGCKQFESAQKRWFKDWDNPLVIVEKPQRCRICREKYRCSQSSLANQPLIKENKTHKSWCFACRTLQMCRLSSAHPDQIRNFSLLLLSQSWLSFHLITSS
jgi:hypothetical protein